MKSPSRRRFLYRVLGAGGAVGLGAVLRYGGASADGEPTPARFRPETEHLETVARQTHALGTRVSITVRHGDGQHARRAVDAAVAELRQVDRLMSLYRPESPLCRLNRDGVLSDPHPYLVDVLRRSAAMSRRSGGALDVTVGPLWQVFAEAARASATPEAAAVEDARRRVDWRRIEIADGEIRLHGRGTAITLNGVAQGYAADRATAALRRRGIRHALVDAGEIGTLGGKSSSQQWTVGIQHPRREDAYVETVDLRGRCLATSGDYATSFSPDFRDNHLFDPRTGRSPTVLSSVSVAAPTALEADALSTALFVLGPERGRPLLRSTPGADALFVLKDGTALATGSFPTAG
ncbi:MAG: FAD:protein FMN transferase [Planctomycetes bacterium]|nr:FAD:protein FMN transferase [Planctomycetota bacterium]